MVLVEKKPPANTRDVRIVDLMPELGRSVGERKGYPLQYSCLENSMDCIVHRVAKSRTFIFRILQNKYLQIPLFHS